MGTYKLADYPFTSGADGVAGTCDTASLTAIDTAEVEVEGVRFATNDDASSRADFILALLD